mgnify:CR=1 FL=1
MLCVCELPHLAKIPPTMIAKTGKIFFIAVLGVLSVVASRPLAAETTDGVRLEVDGMYLWPERSKADAAVRTRREGQGGGDFSDPVFGGDVDVEPDSEIALRAEIQAREGEWGAGLSGWWIDTDGTETITPRSDAVGPPFPDPPGTFLEGVFVPSLSSVTTDIGNQGSYEDSSLTRMDFKAETGLELWKLDIYGIREVINRPRSQLDLLYGMEVVDFESDRTERVRDILPTVSDPGVSTQVTEDLQQSKADWDISLGPMLGLQVALDREKHRFGMTLTQSLIWADVDYTARITTAQREKLVDGTTSGTASVLNTYSRKDDEWVPVSELKLQYLYRLTERFAVGGGGFLSVWWDAPVATEFNRDQDETIVFAGVMLSAEYRFGRGREPVQPAAVIKPPPPPPPAVARVPFRQNMTFSGTAGFGFDEASLDADARRELDGLITGLQGKEEIRVRVAGYACRIGSESYNLALSERRARAVGDYLRASGLDADIVVEGCGESDPIVECPGLRGAELIDCLAPNRRVEIEVSAVELITPTE